MTLSRAQIIDLVRDIAGVAGVASIAYGAWLITPPLGFIVGGAIVLAGVISSLVFGGR